MISLSTQTALMFAVIFSGLAYYAHGKKDAMWLWPGTRTNGERLRDIGSFNHKVAATWGIYSLLYWASAAISFINSGLSDLVMTYAATYGLLVLAGAFTYIWMTSRKPKP